MRSTTFRNSERLQSQARQTAGPRNAAKHKIDSTQRRERVNTREVQEEGTVAKQRSTQYHLNATIAEQRCAQYQFEVTDTQVSSPHTLLDCHSAETIYSSLGTSAKAFMGSFQLEPYAKVNEIPLQQDSTQTVDRPKVNPTPDIAEDPANSPRQVNPTFPVEPTTQWHHDSPCIIDKPEDDSSEATLLKSPEIGLSPPITATETEPIQQLSPKRYMERNTSLAPNLDEPDSIDIPKMDATAQVLATQLVLNIKEMIQTRWIEIEHYIKKNPHLRHKAPVEEELQETLDKICLDAEVVLTASEITPKSLGRSQTAPHNIPIIQPSSTTLQRLQAESMSMQAKALIGYARRNLGPRLLQEWATNMLHKSFTILTMLGGGFFEIVFEEEEGRRNALARPHHFKQTEILLMT